MEEEHGHALLQVSTLRQQREDERKYAKSAVDEAAKSGAQRAREREETAMHAEPSKYSQLRMACHKKTAPDASWSRGATTRFADG